MRIRTCIETIAIKIDNHPNTWTRRKNVEFRRNFGPLWTPWDAYRQKVRSGEGDSRFVSRREGHGIHRNKKLKLSQKSNNKIQQHLAFPLKRFQVRQIKHNRDKKIYWLFLVKGFAFIWFIYKFCLLPIYKTYCFLKGLNLLSRISR